MATRKTLPLSPTPRAECRKQISSAEAVLIPSNFNAIRPSEDRAVAQQLRSKQDLLTFNCLGYETTRNLLDLPTSSKATKNLTFSLQHIPPCPNLILQTLKMSPPPTPTPTTPIKRPWINRQLSKLNTKLQKLQPGDHKKNKVKIEDPTGGDAAGNASMGMGMGREAGFSAFGAGDFKAEGKGKGKENIDVLELGDPRASDEDEDELFKDFHQEAAKGKGAEVTEPVGEKADVGAGSGIGSGCGTDAVDHARTHAMVPFDGGSGSSSGGRTIEGDITKNTALNSHPVAGLFRKD
ncbi:hypothetical protein DL98DRAFT_536170 [Cadophora sp. DSE1049]|nr:hypothetical protein DL98DRAFT_536170 [Cadophora sp. DSE1049]